MNGINLETRSATERRVEVLFEAAETANVARHVPPVRRIDDLLGHRTDRAKQRPREIMRRAQWFRQVAQDHAGNGVDRSGNLLEVRLSQRDDVDELISR